MKTNKSYKINIFLFTIFIIFTFTILFIINIYSSNPESSNIVEKSLLPVFVLPEYDIKHNNQLKSVFFKKTIFKDFKKEQIIKEIKSYNKDNEETIINKQPEKLFRKLLNKNILKLEVTVIFNDEDHPSKFIDFFYDIYRKFKYHRIDDVETFFIYYEIINKNNKNKEKTSVQINDEQNVSQDTNELLNQNYIYIPLFVLFTDTYGYKQKFFEKKVKHFKTVIDCKDFSFYDNRIIIYITTWNHLFSNINTNRNLSFQTYMNYPVFNGSRNFVEETYKNK